MIIRLTQDMSTIGFRVNETMYDQQVITWEDFELVILPGQHDGECIPNGSPWFLTGCWPGKRTDVDVANTRPDFPPIIAPAYKLDLDGRIMFHIDARIKSLPPGRYTGILRVAPHPHDSGQRARLVVVAPKEKKKVLPMEYMAGAHSCDVKFASSSPPPPRRPAVCELARFDIDLGLTCTDHIITQVSVDFPPNDCGVSDGAT